MVILKEFLGFLRTKALNHIQSILCYALYVKRYIGHSLRCGSYEFSEESSKIVYLGEPNLSAQRPADVAFFDALRSVKKFSYSGVTQGTI